MEATPRQIVICQDEEGREPFTQWYRHIRDLKAAAIILKRIGRVGDGNLGDVAPVGGGISELRIDFGPGYRIYFGQLGNQVHIIHGGTKRTQPEDIRFARRFWREYAQEG